MDDEGSDLKQKIKKKLIFYQKMLYICRKHVNMMAKSVYRTRKKEGFYEQICKACRL